MSESKRLPEYHSLRNRFVLSTLDSPLNLAWCTPAWVQQLLHPYPQAHGLLVLENIQDTLPQAYIFNADGSYGGFSGNGARILAACLIQQTQKEAIEFQLGTQHVTAWQEGHSIATAHSIGLKKGARLLHLPEFGPTIVAMIDTGNPHALFLSEHTPEVFYEHAQAIADQIAPQGINVSMVSYGSSQHYTLTTFERGVGPTPACSSSAIALATLLGPTPEEITVHTQGGDLTLRHEEHRIIVKAVLPELITQPH